MIIYRVERMKGNGHFGGVYQSLDECMLEAGLGDDYHLFNNPRTHPMVWDDDIIRTLKKYHYFGFKDTYQLASWFYRDLMHILAMLGNHFIKVYECDEQHCVLGQRQLIFTKEFAEELGSVSICEENLDDINTLLQDIIKSKTGESV